MRLCSSFQPELFRQDRGKYEWGRLSDPPTEVLKSIHYSL